ncbi:TPA: hypothetical protein DDW69_04655 [candidate division CPR2 bacterium]|uniref:Regulatory protein RecX n=1 Tax=candidate division CPR2 bacterium GW2011_GWC1_41_48 TaxID=1618344 RepID=A0A0G0W8M9_UNCC2|nr:MAG: Regulatory protein RecX [candidate division CPR2 bacterium GW2011_GWC2_39_35]KKR28539.1 MAG: Regulatory protein RecX [candidate division CPR2 bacterium GW2011_GWD2_39_7]KKS09335.1 MAG: Regulatory protein RecX [candidate division CPR2 bacterium GW2011_GWC1_41_48]OGB72811.1 MAG: hypothetical protein A2Y26_04850 [candidate division CPR2 bacterium GWD2_39_7]HBG82091.1 hypothetical protein [candidate division CPR2 bacterium]
MQITKIEQGKKRQDRANVYIDGEFAFAIYLDILVRHGLVKGQDIGEDRINQIIREDELGKAYDRALRFLGYRMRSEKEVRDKLKEKEYQDFVIDEVIERLKKNKFINDSQFADSWVRDRTNLKPTGKKMLELELKQKGISESIIINVLSRIDKEDEFELAQKLASKRKFEDLAPEVRKKKITDYLLRRGFGWDVIKEILKEESVNE